MNIQLDDFRQVSPRFSRPSRNVTYLTLFLLCTIAAIFTAAPYISISSRPYSATPSSKYEVTQRSVPQTSDELLADSLLLLRDMLMAIAEADDSTAALIEGKPKLSSRGIISDIGNFFTGMGMGGGGGDGGGGGGFSGAIAEGAKYLGVGIGNGSITGLEVPNSLLKQNNVNPPAKGINRIAQNLGQGLSSQVIGSVNVKALLPSGPGGFNPSARALAQGLGSGAAAGLKLKAVDPNAFNSTGFQGLAGNIGQGLTTSFLDGVDVRKMLSMAAGNMSAEQTNAAALALAQGLGSGAAFAVKLSNTPPTDASFNKDGINGIAGNVGQGLSTTFLQGVDIKSLAGGATSMFSGAKMLEVAQGLGSGLGEGAVVGIGLQPASVMTPPANMLSDPGAMPDPGVLTEMFARGLSQSFLSNGTLSKAATLLGGGQLMKLDMKQIAQGLAVGLVDGVQDGIENAGGIGAILSMDQTSMMGMMSLPTKTTFDDSVGGAAVGFGNGLGFETTKGLLQALGKAPMNAEQPQAGVGTSTNSTRATTPVAGSSMVTLPLPVSTDTPVAVANPVRRAAIVHYARQANTTGAEAAPTSVTLPPLPKLDTMMLSTTIDPVLQMGSDVLGCQGIGGLAAIFKELQKSTALSGGKLENITSALGSFTNQTYTVHDKSGNTFTINIDKAELTVNGNAFQTEFFLIAAHIAFAIVAFVITLPLILVINSSRNIAHLTGRTHILQNASRYQSILAIVLLLPAMIGTLVLSYLGEGARNHFYSPHGILGLTLLLLTLTLFPLAFLRARNTTAQLAFKVILSLVMILSVFELMSGFVDLATISSCLFQSLPQVIFVISGFLFAVTIFQTLTLMSVEVFLKRWLSNGLLSIGSGNLDGEQGDRGRIGKKEYIISRPMEVDGISNMKSEM